MCFVCFICFICFSVYLSVLICLSLSYAYLSLLIFICFCLRTFDYRDSIELADFLSCSFSGFNYSTPIPWTASTVWAKDDRGPSQQTPDFHQMLQGLIAQATWNGTGPIIVALRDVSSGMRDVYSYEGNPLKAASVLIRYYDSEFNLCS